MPATRSASLFWCDAFSPNARAHSFHNLLAIAFYYKAPREDSNLHRPAVQWPYYPIVSDQVNQFIIVIDTATKC